MTRNAQQPQRKPRDVVNPTAAASGKRKRALLRHLVTASYKRIAVYALSIALAGLILLLIILRAFSTDLPSLEQLETYEPRLITKVLDRDGKTLKEFYTEKRVILPLDSLSEHLVDAVLATEDQRFYHHWGVDPMGIIRAAMVNFASMSTEQGASTLTQQLARNLHLHLRQTLERKIREAITAVQIERTYAKDEILEMYFTQMYFGHGAYGVESASQLYFSKSARDLNLQEAALIIGLLKAPNNYTPIRYPDRAKQRRNVVLSMMRNAGYVDEATYREAADSPVVLGEDAVDDLGSAPYFTEWVRQQLEDLEGEYGFDYYRDGLTVHTTLDSALQSLAEAAVDSHLIAWQESFERYRAPEHVKDYLAAEQRDTLLAHGFAEEHDDLYPESFEKLLDDSARALATLEMRDTLLVDSLIEEHFQVQMAFIAMDPANGDILAMIGGRDFNESKFNRAVQAERQPGSVFKPFVYATAIDNGIYGNHRVLNMVQPVLLDDGTWWRPENYDITNRGEYVTMRDALRMSLNNVTVRMVTGDQQVIPIQAVIQTAHRLGIRSKLQPYPAVALGANDVIPIDVITAYGVFANGGTRVMPRAITSIEDKIGQQVMTVPVQRDAVLSEETAAIIRNMLEDVINRGTGGSARWKYRFYAPAGGKTGTTNNFNNAWFAGFTPHIVAVVWVGFDDPKVSLGRGQAGSVAALPVWARFMKWAYEEKGWPYDEFELPVGVVEVQIDKDTGMRAGPLSADVYTELFRRGDEPPYGR